jgi:hypothetical protein
MYLEIGGRQSGKTTRLIKAARQYVELDERKMANVIVPNEQAAVNIRNRIEETIGKTSQFRYTTPERKNAIVRGYQNVRNFFDEFDFMGFTVKKNDPFFFGDEFQNDYFFTSPSKIRDLGAVPIQELAKTDFLIRLLLENHGMYCAFVNTMADPAWINSLKEFAVIDEKISLKEFEKKYEQFEAEFEGRFLKY